ncbi:MAG: hypothetical protein ACYCPH_02990 [Minisyncoccota bacterium]
MNTYVFYGVLIIAEAMILLQALFAHRDGFLTPRQMVLVAGVDEGLPFSAHGAMWGDAFLISPLVAAIVARWSAEWSEQAILMSVTIGIIASLVMHDGYKKSPFPEAHVRSGHLTATGRVHAVYMAAVIAVLLLYYFDTPYAPYMWTVSAVLIFHTVIGTHVVLGLVKPTWYPGRPLESTGTWIPILATALLTLGWTAYLALR